MRNSRAWYSSATMWWSNAMRCSSFAAQWFVCAEFRWKSERRITHDFTTFWCANLQITYTHSKQCKVSKQCIAVQHQLSSSPLRETCHMGSHSVTCHPTEVKIPPLLPAEASTRFSDPGGMQGWVDLCYVKATGQELNPPPVNRKSNALPLSHHATLHGTQTHIGYANEWNSSYPPSSTIRLRDTPRPKWTLENKVV